METQHSEFNHKNLFMTTEGHEQEGEAHQKNFHSFNQRNQLEAVCEEMEKSSYLQTYRSGAEGNPPNSQVIHHETSVSNDDP